MEHHTYLGNIYVGDTSALIIKEIFECPRLRKLLVGTDKKIDLNIARMFLDLWAAFTCLDVSGVGPRGFLINARMEFYYRTTLDLYDIFQRNVDNYDTALAEIEKYAKGKFMLRLCGLLFSFDAQSDDKLPPFQEDNSHLVFYTQRINEAVQNLIAKGEIKPSDWEELQNSFYRIMELPYCVAYYATAWSNPGVDKNSPQMDAKIYDGFIKYLILLNRAAVGCREICVIKGEGKGVMRSVSDLDDYLPQIRVVIDQAKDLVREEDKTYFADANGQKINKSPVMYRKGESLIVDLSPLIS